MFKLKFIAPMIASAEKLISVALSLFLSHCRRSLRPLFAHCNNRAEYYCAVVFNGVDAVESQFSLFFSLSLPASSFSLSLPLLSVILFLLILLHFFFFFFT